MKIYFIGIATNWQTGRLNLFVTNDRCQIPASCKELHTVKAQNQKQAKNQYLYGQI